MGHFINYLNTMSDMLKTLRKCCVENQSESDDFCGSKVRLCVVNFDFTRQTKCLPYGCRSYITPIPGRFVLSYIKPCTEVNAIFRIVVNKILRCVLKLPK